METLILKIPFTTALAMKYLGINPTEDVQNLHSETYETLLKDIKKTGPRKSPNYFEKKLI